MMTRRSRQQSKSDAAKIRKAKAGPPRKTKVARSPGCRNKTRFPQATFAEQALAKMRERTGGQGYMYLCPDCNGWHLSSRATRPKGARPKQ